MKKRALIVGGTSGLGLDLARCLSHNSYQTHVTGRRMASREFGISFHALDLTAKNIAESITALLSDLMYIDLFVYTAGFYQERAIEDLTKTDVDGMLSVGLTAPILFLSQLLRRQRTLPGFIAITSTSAWTPRPREAVYAAAKSGLGILAQSVSLDGNVLKTLVVGPAGMDTGFWRNTEKDTKHMLSSSWVAAETMKLWEDSYSYRHAKILREPPRVEITNER